MYLETDRRPGLTPQLAVRIAVLGFVALVGFAVIFFRLWYLQVLSGDRYLQEANNNRVREIRVQAPRGEILDRNGRVLVANRPSLALEVTPDKLPRDRARRQEVFRRLGRILGVSPRRIERSVERQFKAMPFAAATVRQDVSLPVVAYVLEHQDRLPGVTVERVFLRSYPYREIGAHLFGTVGEVTAEQLRQDRYRGVAMGDRVGQSGIEYEYDRFLRGRNGANRVQVDALGRFKGELSVRRPIQGRNLRLSIDLDVQRAGQAALASGTGRGAFVVMDVRTGEVIALGSQPSFDPNIFAKIVRASDYRRLTDPLNGAPLLNRAIQSGYPTGSTFKVVTAAAALETGLITPGSVIYDPGSITISGITFRNAGGKAHGAVDVRRALTVSSDVFFYRLGADLNARGTELQRWAHALGFGRRTGIDLPGEWEGLVPSPAWRNRLFKRRLTDRPWTVGDNVNLAVGQGDLRADPVQLAVAYAAIANGGRVVVPRIGLRVEDASGRPIQSLQAPPARSVRMSQVTRQAILDGLRGATSAPGGTATPVFQGFPIPVAGKTGTAEKGAGRADQSWFVGLAPYPEIRYVVVVTDEAGGFGAETAAPMARRILAALFDVRNDRAPSGSAPD